MQKDRYLLVCEGPSDIAIIKAVTNKLSEMQGREIEIKELSPSRDNTTKRYPEHGWKEVRSWCRRYGDAAPVASHQNSAMADALARVRLRNNWKSLVAFDNAKGLIIQLDTDIAHHLNVNGLSGVPGDRGHCHSAILDWLGIDACPQNLYFLLPSFSTENWILATHDESEAIFDGYAKPLNYEGIPDPCDLMVKAKYRAFFNNDKNKKVPSKDYDLYAVYGQKICTKIDDVKARCTEFDAFCNYL